jgi:hypothetical protein
LKAGAVAQLGERRVCNAEVAGSIPVGSIERFMAGSAVFASRREKFGKSLGWCEPFRAVMRKITARKSPHDGPRRPWAAVKILDK